MRVSTISLILAVLVCSIGCLQIESIAQNLLNRDYSKALAKGPSPDDDMLRFIVFGDFGRVNLYQNISKIAEAMNTLAQKDHYSFMITVGDNFYPNGIRYSWFRLIPWVVMTNYKRSAIKDIPIYGSIGNHDCYSNYSNEVLYSKYDSQWTVPSDYYVLKEQMKDDPSKYMVNLMLNSCKMMCPGSDWSWAVGE